MSSSLAQPTEHAAVLAVMSGMDTMTNIGGGTKMDCYGRWAIRYAGQLCVEACVPSVHQCAKICREQGTRIGLLVTHDFCVVAVAEQQFGQPTV